MADDIESLNASQEETQPEFILLMNYKVEFDTNVYTLNCRVTVFIKEQFTVLLVCEGIENTYLGTENHITFN